MPDSKDTLATFSERFREGWNRPVRFKVHRAVLYVLIAASIAWRLPWFVSLVLLFALFESEKIMNVRNGTANPNAPDEPDHLTFITPVERKF